MKSFFTPLLLLVAVSLSAQFSGFYDPSNWTQTNSPGDIGFVYTANAPASITLVGSNGGGGGSILGYEIAIDICGMITFEWFYNSSDRDGPSWDPFGYMVNGIPVQLSNNGGASQQSGTTSVSINPGDVFAFYAYSVDNLFGNAKTDIFNFSGPDAVCYDDEGYAKVELCHNGHSICVNATAVAAHLAHGDVLGTCEENAGCEEEGQGLSAVAHALASDEQFNETQHILIQPRTSSISIGQVNQLRTDVRMVTVYPNPTSETTNLNFVRLTGPVSIRVFDITGREVFSTTEVISHGTPVSINVSGLSEGTYELRATPENGKTITEKLMIVK